MQQTLLHSYGLTRYLENKPDNFLYDQLTLGRICAFHGSSCSVITEDGEVTGLLTGKLLADEETTPATGDWTVIQKVDSTTAVITDILPRKTILARKRPGKKTTEQVMAANVDTAFIVQSCDERFNPSSLERYHILVRQSNIQPVIILSKCDLNGNYSSLVTTLSARIEGVPIIPASTLTGEGLSTIRSFIEDGHTICLLGPSGAGKTSLINALLHDDRLKTGAVREGDSKGRHTTTARQLIRLPDGGLLIDTPGMRELALWESAEDIISAFPDIEALAAECRFSDCTHLNEPGCRVREAIAEAILHQERLDAFHKLYREAKSLEERSGGPGALERKRRERYLSKEIRRFNKLREE